MRDVAEQPVNPAQTPGCRVLRWPAAKAQRAAGGFEPPNARAAETAENWLRRAANWPAIGRVGGQDRVQVVGIINHIGLANFGHDSEQEVWISPIANIMD